MSTETFRDNVVEAVALFFAPVIAVGSAFGKVVSWRLERHEERAAAAAAAAAAAHQDLVEKAERTLADSHRKIAEEMELTRAVLEQIHLHQQHQLRLQYDEPPQQRQKAEKRAVVAA